MSVVVRGEFNPTIVTPAWLLHQELISAEDYAEAKTQIVSPDVTILSTPDFNITLTRDALQAATTDIAAFEPLRDLVTGILRTLMHTPISVLGINRAVHLAVDDVNEYHTIGDLLAPKKYWNDLLPFAGMQSLVIQGMRQDSDRSGKVEVTIQPSNVYVPGVFVVHNDHFALVEWAEKPKTRNEFRSDPRESEALADRIPVALEILQEEWAASVRRSDAVIERVWMIRKTEGEGNGSRDD